MPLKKPEWIVQISKKQKDAQKKLPEALKIQKRKFLISLNSSNSSAQEFSAEEEKLVKEVMDNLSLNFLSDEDNTSLPWNDTGVDQHVKSCIEEHAIFDLNKYLNSTRRIFLSLFGINPVIYLAATDVEYVLRHARQFGDTTKNIFQATEDLSNGQTETDSFSEPLPDNKFMNRIDQLIQELRSVYNEDKFKMLNANTTYITLLMLRRFVKNEAEFSAAFQRIQTHNSYVKLCPWPLDNQLPKPNTKMLIESTLRRCVYLVIEAYLNTKDERTKRVLCVTCVQYMEWNGLQLPRLFFKAIELYEIDAGQLWDLLTTNKTEESLLMFANEYYDKHRSSIEDPNKTQHWFPFCRMLNGYYHKNLSASKNQVICSILAYLIDFKLGFNNSTLRHSHWVKSNAQRNKDCQQYAEKIYKKLELSAV